MATLYLEVFQVHLRIQWASPVLFVTCIIKMNRQLKIDALSLPSASCENGAPSGKADGVVVWTPLDKGAVLCVEGTRSGPDPYRDAHPGPPRSQDGMSHPLSLHTHTSLFQTRAAYTPEPGLHLPLPPVPPPFRMNS